MKRHAIGALVLVCLFAAAPGGAQTSSELCYPDCPDSKWGPQDFFGNPILQHQTIVLTNGCRVTVDYLIRCACNTWNDVFVHSVTPDPSDPDCAYMHGQTVSANLDEVTLELLKGAFDIPRPCNSDIAPGQCNTMWRVVKGSCWSRILAPYDYYYPCNPSSVCCLKRYQVCRDSSGCRTVTPLSSPSYPADCSACSPAYQPSDSCEPVCGG